MRNISKAGILMVAAITTSFISASAAGADHGGRHCDELPANINPAHPDWHDSLDLDHDRIGCDDDDAPLWQPEPPAPAPPPPAPPTTAAPAPASAPLPAPAPPAVPVAGEPDFTG